MSLPSLQKYHKEPYASISPTRPELDHSGKTVIVAGASTGIGLAIAQGFAAAGAHRVILLARRPDVIEKAAAKIKEEVAQMSNSSTIVDGRVCDIGDLQDTAKFWSALEQEGIYVNTLVISAAAFGKSMPILDNDLESVWRDFEINVRAPLDWTMRFYRQTTGKGQKYLVYVSTVAAYMWSTMGPERPTYGLTKNSGTLVVQQIAKDTKPDDMQIVSFHPGGVLTEAAIRAGMNGSNFKLDDANLAGNFAVWAATKEATFLHGRFIWANWDVDEIKNGEISKQIQEDEHFLKVGIEGLTEKTGGMII